MQRDLYIPSNLPLDQMLVWSNTKAPFSQALIHVLTVAALSRPTAHNMWIRINTDAPGLNLFLSKHRKVGSQGISLVIFLPAHSSVKYLHMDYIMQRL